MSLIQVPRGGENVLAVSRIAARIAKLVQGNAGCVTLTLTQY